MMLIRSCALLVFLGLSGLKMQAGEVHYMTKEFPRNQMLMRDFNWFKGNLEFDINKAFNASDSSFWLVKYYFEHKGGRTPEVFLYDELDLAFTYIIGADMDTMFGLKGTYLEQVIKDGICIQFAKLINKLQQQKPVEQKHELSKEEQKALEWLEENVIALQEFNQLEKPTKKDAVNVEHLLAEPMVSKIGVDKLDKFFIKNFSEVSTALKLIEEKNDLVINLLPVFFEDAQKAYLKFQKVYGK